MVDNRELLLGRIASRLHELFDGSINLSDVANKPANEQERYFLTRSLAAISLLDEAELKPDQAGPCVTDGGTDDGIDGVFVDEKEKVMCRASGDRVPAEYSLPISRGLETG
jgi:hypothetical protein